MRCAWILLRRDIALLARNPSAALLPPMFFVLAAAVFPLAAGPSPETLRATAPGVFWSAALLSSLLTQDSLFRADYEDGALEQMLLSGRPAILIALAKAAAHWLSFGAPLILAAPLLGLWLAMSGEEIIALFWTVPLGAGVFSLLSVFAAALLVGARANQFLGALITLPLCMPAVIFAAAAARGETAPLLFLAALFALSATVLPPAAAGALRIGVARR
ncbi:MAG: heme exporter protein CcmB [Gammaproteobacteria bacterium]